VDLAALAGELDAAYAARKTTVVPPSTRDATFDLNSAYEVEAKLVASRRARGRRTTGVKVGFANKAVWRVMKLDTLVWAHLYDDTVQYVQGEDAALSIARMASPKIEPEIVFKLKQPLTGTSERLDAASALAGVEWLALGFEIIDCVYPEWKFQPEDFVAAFGLHAALVVGAPMTIDTSTIPDLVDRLPRFVVKLMKNGVVVAEGTGRNSLRSPASCLAELASAMSRRPETEPLAAGDLVSSGTLTESQPLGAAELWRAEVDGIDLPPLSLTITA
jgi:2-oxo-3-hexenedioate decarboxylase